MQSQFGFHIIRLDDIRDAQLPKFEDVKPQIAQQLQRQKLAKFTEELRAKAKGQSKPVFLVSLKRGYAAFFLPMSGRHPVKD